MHNKIINTKIIAALDKKSKVINTKRGGKITVHNPRQKIIYLVINLNKRKKDIRKFINVIEKTIIEFLGSCQVRGETDKENIGIWVKDKKIAAIGLRVTKWIAYHGFSININNNLSNYNKIIPCGLSNNKITSVVKEKGKIPLNIEEKIKDIFLRNLSKI